MNQVPEIGKDIAWSDVIQMVFRAVDFDRNGTTIDLDRGAESVRAKSETEPYGYLLVESPTLNQAVGMPIIHNNDFYLASSIFDDPNFANLVNDPETELLVTYAPKHHVDGYSASPDHVLHYVIAPRGTLESYYSDDKIGNRRMTLPETHLIFGPFKYEGMIQVQIRPNINL